jgi:uncharacterized membrane protein YecN with MAPEG domain
MKQKREQEQMVSSLFVVMVSMILRMQMKVKAIKEKKKYQEKSVMRLGVYHYLYSP